MSAEDPLLLDLADAILDKRTPDWSDAASRATASQRELIGHLRAVAAIASFGNAGAEDDPASCVRSAWGHLHILESIGRGAFGCVYRAWDPQLRREVALKLLPDTGALGNSALEEGQRLASVRHPNVVTIYGADRVDGIVGLWMEFVHGHTLECLVTQERPLPVDRFRAVAASLCSAVAAVHRAGLIHRDIKAHNVMIDAEGRVVLMDFGTGLPSSDTSSEDVAGTPLYLAPEVFCGKPPGSASDQYSVAVLLYYVLTGRYPVEGGTFAELREKHALGMEPPDVRALRPDIPRQVARAIGRALDPDPAARFDTLEELAAALAAPTRRRRHAAVGAVALATVVGLIVAGTPLGRRIAASIPIGVAPSDVRTSTTVPVSRRLSLPPALLVANGLSYDGRIYAFAAVDGSPVAMDMATQKLEQFARPDSDGYAEFVIASPDARRIAYAWWDRSSRVSIHVATRGRQSDAVIFNDPRVEAAEPVDWSRDGSSIACLIALEDGTRRVIVVDLASRRQRAVHEIHGGQPTGVTMSPDTRYLTFDLPDAENPARRTMRIVALDGGGERVLLPDDRSNSRFPLWTPDGRHIVFISDRSGTPEGWMLPVANGHAAGEPEIVARNLARVNSLGLTADGTFYYRLQDREFEVYEQPLDPRTMQAAGRPHAVATAFRGSNVGPSYSHDGRLLAYVSQRSELGGRLGTRVIVLHDRQSGTERDLSVPLDLSVMAPAWSPDNRRLLVRATDWANRWGLFVVDATSGHVENAIVWPQRNETDYGRAAWSADGTAVLFVHQGQILKRTLSTGEEHVIFTDPAAPPRRIAGFAYAPDGRLAYTAIGTNTTLNIVDARGAVRTLITVPRPGALAFQGWLRDWTHLLYSTFKAGGGEPDVLWRVPATGGPSEPIGATVNGITRVNAVAIDPRGSAVAYTTGAVGNSVWVTEHFLPR